MRFEIDFFGHKNVRSTHRTTLEITADRNLTTRGNCIIGINSNYSCNNLPDSLKKKIQDPKSIVKITIVVNNLSFKIIGKGHNSLSLTHVSDIVVRKSNYICPRTLAIQCDNASRSIPKKMIKLLQNPKTKGKFIIDVI